MRAFSVPIQTPFSANLPARTGGDRGPSKHSRTAATPKLTQCQRSLAWRSAGDDSRLDAWMRSQLRENQHTLQASHSFNSCFGTVAGGAPRRFVPRGGTVLASIGSWTRRWRFGDSVLDQKGGVANETIHSPCDLGRCQKRRVRYNAGMHGRRKSRISPNLSGRDCLLHA